MSIERSRLRRNFRAQELRERWLASKQSKMLLSGYGWTPESPGGQLSGKRRQISIDDDGVHFGEFIVFKNLSLQSPLPVGHRDDRPIVIDFNSSRIERRFGRPRLRCDFRTSSSVGQS